jgi:hypothetical protein
MFRILSDRSDFQAALKTATELSAERSLWWRVSSVGIAVRLDEQAVEYRFAQDDKGRQSFERILEREIAWGLEVNLSGVSVREAFSFMVEKPSAEEQEEAQRRIELVAEMFVTPAFKERWQLRKTMKGLALDEVRWDINVKKYDLTDGRLDDIPFAFLEFELSEGKNFTPFPGARRRFFYPPYQERSQRFGFSCHPAELDALIRDLQVLKDNLERLGGKK